MDELFAFSFCQGIVDDDCISIGILSEGGLSEVDECFRWGGRFAREEGGRKLVSRHCENIAGLAGQNLLLEIEFAPESIAEYLGSFCIRHASY